MARSIGTLKAKLAQIEHDQLAVIVLACIAWTPQPTNSELIREVTYKAASCSALEFDKTTQQLQERGLLAADLSLIPPHSDYDLLRDLLIQEREPVLVAYEQVIAKAPESNSTRNLLNVLRYEYSFLRQLQGALTKSLGISAHASPMLVMIECYALFSTDEKGERQVTLYRLGTNAILSLEAGAKQWKKLTERETNYIRNLCLSVYPTIKGGWTFRQD